MSKPINVLIVDDCEEDVLQEIRELTKAGLNPLYKRVENTEDFLKAMESKNWDIILCNYSMPSLSGIEALKLLRKKNRDLPFIFISGTLGEDEAVAAIKCGANDYILKENLKRLAVAIECSITEAKNKKQCHELERQFLQAQKMESLGKLTSGIIHDFNNLLLIIQANMELLDVDIPENSPSKTYIEQTLNAVNVSTALIKRLMAFACQQPYSLSVIDLKILVPEIVQLLKPIIGSGIEINSSISPTIWPMLVDRSQFESAIINLAINARDAMHGMGKLTITAINHVINKPTSPGKFIMQSGNYVKISITDNGYGIPADQLEKIFEPFYTTKIDSEGSGLGLSMVYGFAKQSKGYVIAQSELKKGTTFTIYIPQYRENR